MFSKFLNLIKDLQSDASGFKYLLRSEACQYAIVELLQMTTKLKFASFGDGPRTETASKSIFGNFPDRITYFYLSAAPSQKDLDLIDKIFGQGPLLIVQGYESSKNSLEKIALKEAFLADKLSCRDAENLCRCLFDWPEKKFNKFEQLLEKYFFKGVLLRDLIQLFKLAQLVKADQLMDVFLVVKQNSLEQASIFVLPQKLFKSYVEFWNDWIAVRDSYPVQFWTAFWIGFFSKSISAKVCLELGIDIPSKVSKSINYVSSLSNWRKARVDVFSSILLKIYLLDWKSKNGFSTLPEFEDIFIGLS